jgi:hypothetical protein
MIVCCLLLQTQITLRLRLPPLAPVCQWGQGRAYNTLSSPYGPLLEADEERKSKCAGHLVTTIVN